MRWAWAALLLLSACSSKGQGLQDGGGFQLPDGGFPDAAFPDAAPVDAGPFVCEPACTAGVCGCLEEPAPSCGCHPAGAFNDPCDPQHPESCGAPLLCQPSRINDQTVYRCSDGREGAACSHASDNCTTALGCVCLTSPIGITDCTCLETVDPNTMLCDRMVPASCPNGACVRQIGSQGNAWFFCSHGALGDPCEPSNDQCQTSLGCTCPLVSGQERCLCSEPGTMEGDLCDLTVVDACVAPLMCTVQMDLEGLARNTVCRTPSNSTPDGGMSGDCDPTDPNSCPPGSLCLRMLGRFQCS